MIDFNFLTTEAPMNRHDRLAMWRHRYYMALQRKPNGNHAAHVEAATLYDRAREYRRYAALLRPCQ